MLYFIHIKTAYTHTPYIVTHTLNKISVTRLNAICQAEVKPNIHYHSLSDFCCNNFSFFFRNEENRGPKF